LRQNRLHLTITQADKQFDYAGSPQDAYGGAIHHKLAFVAEKTALNCVQVQTSALLDRKVGGRLTHTEYQLRDLG
jgi:hypothetical protein